MKKFVLLSALFAAVFSITAQTTYKDFKYDKLVKAKLGPVKKDIRTKKVFISDFVLKQTTALSASAQGFGAVGDEGGSKTSLALALYGVTEPNYQKVVDKLYSEFVSQLKQAGFQIINDDAGYQAYKENGFKEKIIAEKIGGEAKVLTKKTLAIAEFRPSDKLIVMRDQQDLNSMANFSAQMAEQKIGRKMAKSLDATVLKVEFDIGIAAIKLKSSVLSDFSAVKAWPMLKVNGRASLYGGKRGALGSAYTKKPVEEINYWVQNLSRKGRIEAWNKATDDSYLGWSRKAATSPIVANEKEFLTELEGAISNINKVYITEIKDKL